MNQIHPIGLPVDPFQGISLTQWESLISQHRPGLVYLTSNFQNPTGYSYSSHELSSILDWSQKYEFGILEDDWGSDILSYSEFRPSLRAIGGNNVFYMNSFTKKLLPSLRIGYVLGNEKTIASLVMAKKVSITGISSLIEAALFEFLDRGYYDAHLKKVQKEMDSRYQNCLSLLQSYMPSEVKWTSPGGGPVLWLECPKRLNLEKLIHKLHERKIRIQTSEDAFFGPPHLHGFKIGYAFISKKEMQTGIEILSEEIKKSL
jgi:2-aminoadipate transaminase